MLKGNSFLRKEDIPSDQQCDIKHLRFIISDPDPDNSVMVVNMTTYYGTGREDNACILNVGDHPFIKRKSYIIYRFAEEFDYTKLLSEKFAGKIIYKEALTPGILGRIQAGAKKSKFLPAAFAKYFQFF